MGVLIPPKSGIWGKTRERQNQILTKTLKNKGKYIAYERESCISDGWKVIEFTENCKDVLEKEHP